MKIRYELKLRAVQWQSPRGNENMFSEK